MVESITFNIYILRNPIDNSVFYVGKTKSQLPHRLKAHIYNSNIIIDRPYQRINQAKGEVIRNIISMGFSPQIELVETITVVTELEGINAEYKEIFWIEYYLKQDQPLTNKIGVTRKLNRVIRPQSSTIKHVSIRH